MDLSIVIRTKNEARAILGVLELIRSQSGVLSSEIIVVDSGSTDETIPLLRRQMSVRLIEIPSKEFTFGRALNVGIKAAIGEIIVCLSAHAFPEGNRWLSNLVRHFDDCRVAGVYGRQLPQAGAWPPVKRDFLHSPYTDQLRIQVNPEDPQDYFFSNANAALRRSCWLERPFDESFPGCEDWEWARAMLLSGYKIVYEPEATVYHSHNESLLAAYRRSRREAQAQRLLVGNPGVGWRRAIKMWLQASADDFRHILSNPLEYPWFFWSPLYRLARIAGQLRRLYPEAPPRGFFKT